MEKEMDFKLLPIQYNPTIPKGVPFHVYRYFYNRYANVILQFCEEYKRSAN